MSLSTGAQAPSVQQCCGSRRAAHRPSSAHPLPLPCQCSWDQQPSLERLQAELTAPSVQDAPVSESGPLTGPPVLSTPEQSCSPCPVLFCRCRPAGSLLCPLLFFYSVLSFLPCWGLFYYFFFHKTNLLVSHLSFLTLLSLTSVEFLRFCCVPALSLLISYAVVCFQLHL